MANRIKLTILIIFVVQYGSLKIYIHFQDHQVTERSVVLDKFSCHKTIKSGTWFYGRYQFNEERTTFKIIPTGILCHHLVQQLKANNGKSLLMYELHPVWGGPINPIISVDGGVTFYGKHSFAP